MDSSGENEGGKEIESEEEEVNGDAVENADESKKRGKGGGEDVHSEAGSSAAWVRCVVQRKESHQEQDSGLGNGLDGLIRAIGMDNGTCNEGWKAVAEADGDTEAASCHGHRRKRRPTLHCDELQLQGAAASAVEFAAGGASVSRGGSGSCNNGALRIGTSRRSNSKSSCSSVEGGGEDALYVSKEDSSRPQGSSQRDAEGDSQGEEPENEQNGCSQSLAGSSTGSICCSDDGTNAIVASGEEDAAL